MDPSWIGVFVILAFVVALMVLNIVEKGRID